MKPDNMKSINEMKTYTVQPGDCLISIAHQYGLSSWQALYEHQANESLRARRPDPSRLMPGDVVVIPEPRQKTEGVVADRNNAFVLRRPSVWFVVVIQNDDGSIVSNQPYELTLAPDKKITGMTNVQGEVKCLIDPVLAEVTLTVWPEGHVSQKKMRWRVQLGNLPPQDTSEGVVSELNNLNLRSGGVAVDDRQFHQASARRLQKTLDNAPDDSLVGLISHAEQAFA